MMKGGAMLELARRQLALMDSQPGSKPKPEPEIRLPQPGCAEWFEAERARKQAETDLNGPQEALK
jgi:hypothetical protein